jgi:hypothetical protein
MEKLQFLNYKNFYLESGNWGEAFDIDVSKLLDVVIRDFFENFDCSKINNKEVVISNSNTHIPPINHPKIIKNLTFNHIFLDCKNHYWSQYSYQFSHELCHHVIDCNWFNEVDRFGWLEESLCELASIFVLYKMSITWNTSPPYENWISYSKQLEIYVNDILIEEKSNIDKSLSSWIIENFEMLSNNRYLRNENRIIAKQLFPIFKENPLLWQTVQFLKSIDISDDTDMKRFFNDWERVLPKHLIDMFGKVKSVFLEN